MNRKGFFFYSAKQKNVIDRGDFSYPHHQNNPTFCKLDDGRIVEYTEWCDTDTPFGEWDDYVFLGEGEYTEETPKTKE